MAALPSFWLTNGFLSRLLRPAEWLFRGLAYGRRRWLARRAVPTPAPTIVVGSLFVGGSGKTPLVVWLLDRARAHGYRPGVVARGYGGRGRGCQRVDAASDPAIVGDEPVMIARMTAAPMVVGRDRVAAVGELLGNHDCDLVIADDGLQHYGLHRDVEIVVLDGSRGLGNGRCLPAGPLREPPSRLRQVDLVVSNGESLPGVSGGHFALETGSATPVSGGHGDRRSPVPGDRVHAVAGIGDPERFFRSLERTGLAVTRHPFPDHHAFKPDDFAFGDDMPVLMTAKDAVKCVGFDDGRLWFVPTRLVPDSQLMAATDAILAGLRGSRG